MSHLDMSEKKPSNPLDLLPEEEHKAAGARKRLGLRLAAACSLWLLVYQGWYYSRSHSAISASPLLKEDSVCPQVEPWNVKEDSLPTTPSPSVLAKLLSGAVQVNTSVYDDYPLPVSSDLQLWQDTFGPFRDYLKATFPLTHSSEKISREIVNYHGLLYTWKGTDSSLKPIVFMAHQGEWKRKQMHPCLSF
jgi:hypothetical protein